jgi:hypothetical protein
MGGRVNTSWELWKLQRNTHQWILTFSPLWFHNLSLPFLLLFTPLKTQDRTQNLFLSLHQPDNHDQSLGKLEQIRVIGLQSILKQEHGMGHMDILHTSHSPRLGSRSGTHSYLLLPTAYCWNVPQREALGIWNPFQTESSKRSTIESYQNLRHLNPGPESQKKKRKTSFRRCTCPSLRSQLLTFLKNKKSTGTALILSFMKLCGMCL